jgi:hypothetical protein
MCKEFALNLNLPDIMCKQTIVSVYPREGAAVDSNHCAGCIDLAFYLVWLERSLFPKDGGGVSTLPSRPSACGYGRLAGGRKLGHPGGLCVPPDSAAVRRRVGGDDVSWSAHPVQN